MIIRIYSINENNIRKLKILLTYLFTWVLSRDTSRISNVLYPKDEKIENISVKASAKANFPKMLSPKNRAITIPKIIETDDDTI